MILTKDVGAQQREKDQLTGRLLNAQQELAQVQAGRFEINEATQDAALMFQEQELIAEIANLSQLLQEINTQEEQKILLQKVEQSQEQLQNIATHIQLLQAAHNTACTDKALCEETLGNINQVLKHLASGLEQLNDKKREQEALISQRHTPARRVLATAQVQAILARQLENNE